MTPEIEARIYAHTQFTARHMAAWKSPSLQKIVEFIKYLIGPDAPPADRLDNFLRRESTQKELASKWETGLWKASDGSWRLICLATTCVPETARLRLARRPKSTNQCRHCWIDEGGKFASLELKPERDIRGEIVPASFLHPVCARSWAQLRYLAEYDRATPPQRHHGPDPIPEPQAISPPKRGPGRPRKPLL